MAILSKTQTVCRIDRTHEIRIEGKELIKLVNQELKASKQGPSISLVPENAEVFITVPGGADWSNTDLDIDSRSPVIIRWKETCFETDQHD
jgi:hypothetical protein